MAIARTSRQTGKSVTRQDELEGQEPATRVLRRFRLVFNAVKTHFRLVERRAGIGGAQLWALSVVTHSPGIGVNDLAKAMDVHQSTASNLVHSLVDSGLLVTKKGVDDGRSVRLTVSSAGQRVLRKAPGPFTGVLPQALKQLDRKTLQRLDADLAKLIAVIGANKRGAGVPLGQD